VFATYFNGRDAIPHPVTIEIDDGIAIVSGTGISRREPLAALQISEALGSAARLVRFPDGAFCEIADTDAIQQLLSQHGIGPGMVSQWEGSVRWVVAGAAMFVAVLVLAYLFAIPSLASVVAHRVPASATDWLGAQVLDVLDRQVFTATELSATRQTQLETAFARLRLPDGAAPTAFRLTFRKSDALGSNALALPSGTIVVTDGLVALAKDDREILGVLAHEAGHVIHRHGLRNMLQHSVVGLLVAWFIGDVSTIAAAAPAALLQAKYSRELETEADLYALAALQANGIPARHLGDLLRRLEAEAGESDARRALQYLSSHPATSERLERLDDPGRGAPPRQIF
jgi:Zn-dependent protease with chaperone function